MVSLVTWTLRLFVFIYYERILGILLTIMLRVGISQGLLVFVKKSEKKNAASATATATNVAADVNRWTYECSRKWSSLLFPSSMFFPRQMQTQDESYSNIMNKNDMTENSTFTSVQLSRQDEYNISTASIHLTSCKVQKVTFTPLTSLLSTPAIATSKASFWTVTLSNIQFTVCLKFHFLHKSDSNSIHYDANNNNINTTVTFHLSQLQIHISWRIILFFIRILLSLLQHLYAFITLHYYRLFASHNNDDNSNSSTKRNNNYNNNTKNHYNIQDHTSILDEYLHRHCHKNHDDSPNYSKNKYSTLTSRYSPTTHSTKDSSTPPLSSSAPSNQSKSPPSSSIKMKRILSLISQIFIGFDLKDFRFNISTNFKNDSNEIQRESNTHSSHPKDNTQSKESNNNNSLPSPTTHTTTDRCLISIIFSTFSTRRILSDSTTSAKPVTASHNSHLIQPIFYSLLQDFFIHIDTCIHNDGPGIYNNKNNYDDSSFFRQNAPWNKPFLQLKSILLCASTKKSDNKHYEYNNTVSNDDNCSHLNDNKMQEPQSSSSSSSENQINIMSSGTNGYYPTPTPLYVSCNNGASTKIATDSKHHTEDIAHFIFNISLQQIESLMNIFDHHIAPLLYYYKHFKVDQQRQTNLPETSLIIINQSIEPCHNNMDSNLVQPDAPQLRDVKDLKKKSLSKLFILESFSAAVGIQCLLISENEQNSSCLPFLSPSHDSYGGLFFSIRTGIYLSRPRNNVSSSSTSTPIASRTLSSASYNTSMDSKPDNIAHMDIFHTVLGFISLHGDLSDRIFFIDTAKLSMLQETNWNASDVNNTVTDESSTLMSSQIKTSKNDGDINLVTKCGSESFDENTLQPQSTAVVQIGSITLNLNDAKKIDYFILLLDHMKHRLSKNSVSNRKKNTKIDGKLNPKRKRGKKPLSIRFSCESLDFCISLRSQGLDDEGNHHDAISSKDNITYSVKLVSITFIILSTPHPASHSDKPNVTFSVSEALVIIIFTPHDSFPLNTEELEHTTRKDLNAQEKTFNLDNANSALLHPFKPSIDQNVHERLINLSITLHKLNVDVTKPPNTKNGDDCGPKIDISINNIQIDEHVNFSDRKDNDSGHITTLLKTNALVQVSVHKEKLSTKSMEGDEIFKLAKFIQINTYGKTLKALWSPVLQWFILSLVNKSETMIQYYKDIFIGRRRNIDTNTFSGIDSKKSPPNIIINCHDTSIMAKAFLGDESVLDITTTGMVVEVTRDVDCSWKKPNITFILGHTEVKVNDFIENVITLSSFKFCDRIRRASAEELDEYSSKRDSNLGLCDEIVCGFDGHPLFNDFSIKFGRFFKLTLPPRLLLGNVIEDLSKFAKSMNLGLLLAGLKRPKDPIEKFQLMDIKFELAMLHANFLERMDAHNEANQRFGASKYHQRMLDRMKLDIKNIAVNIKRVTPRQVTQDKMAEIDEDDIEVMYGPKVDGGDMTLVVDHIVLILHPSNKVSPLATVKKLNIMGQFYMAPVNPQSLGVLKENIIICLPVRCHHQPGICGCNYGVEHASTGIPPKIYHDLSISILEAHYSFGPVLKPSIPIMMDIIKRITPPPPKKTMNESSRALPGWDNLRNKFHGKLRLNIEKLSFRWLLDSVHRYDWSILLTTRNISVLYSTSEVTLVMQDTMASIPGRSYHVLKDDQRKQKSSKYLIDFVDNRHGRHSLLLIPHLRIVSGFTWEMKGKVKSCNHHSMYMLDKKGGMGTLANPLSSDDKYLEFRSQGVNLSLEIVVKQSPQFSTWVALRADVLPWLTHKNPKFEKNQKETPKHSEERFKINQILIRATVLDLRLCAWFDESDEYSIQQQASTEIDNIADGVFLTIPRLMFLLDENKRRKIDLYGAIQAAMLDVIERHNLQNNSPLSPSNDDNDVYLENFHGNDEHFPDILESQTMLDLEDSIRKVTQIPIWKRRSSQDTFNGETNWNSFSAFEILQYSCKQVKSLDYLLVADQINILDTALDDIKRKQRSSGNSQSHENIVSWTVLVAGLKLLWTLEIRDSVMSIVKDLLFAINFMRVTYRGTPQEFIKKTESTVAESVEEESGTSDSDHESKNDQNPSNKMTSHLDYLLNDDGDKNGPVQRDVSVTNSGSINIPKGNEMKCDDDEYDIILKPQRGGRNRLTGNRSHAPGGVMSSMIGAGPVSASIYENRNEFLPTFDLHLSNCQIQLHSEATGGSIILAIRGVYIEGRKYVQLLSKNDDNCDPSIENLFRRSEFWYTLERMEIYCLRTDINVDGGLQWLRRMERTLPKMFPPDLQQHETRDFIIPRIFQLIMEPSTFQTLQVFHRPPIDLTQEELAEAIRNGLVISTNNNIEDDKTSSPSIVDRVQIFVDEFSFLLDSHQFSTTLDLIRNVLLEPPKPTRDRYYQRTSEAKSTKKVLHAAGCLKDSLVDEVEQGIKEFNSIGRYRKRLRDSWKMLGGEVLSSIEDYDSTHSRVCRRVTYLVSKIKWNISCLDSQNDIMVNFTFFKGVHEFTEGGGCSTQIILEDLYVSSNDPSTTSNDFVDKKTVVKTEIATERSPCQRCGEYFSSTDNETSSCAAHPGRYGFDSKRKIYRWTCCEAVWELSPGCVLRPHTGIERAVVVRLDTFPRCIEGLTIYKHIEANIFPGVQHYLILLLTNSIATSCKNYFLGESGEGEPDPPKDRKDSARGKRDVEGNEASKKKALLLGKSHTNEGVITPPKAYTNEETKELEIVLSDEEDEELSNGAKRVELVFVKYWRVGQINIDISCAGFSKIPNLTNQKITLTSFQKAYKVGPSRYLIRMLVSHLVKSLLKSVLDNGLATIRGRFGGKSPNKGIRKGLTEKTHSHASSQDGLIEEEDDEVKVYEDDKTKKEMLLGQPERTKKSRAGKARTKMKAVSHFLSKKKSSKNDG